MCPLRHPDCACAWESCFVLRTSRASAGLDIAVAHRMAADRQAWLERASRSAERTAAEGGEKPGEAETAAAQEAAAKEQQALFKAAAAKITVRAAALLDPGVPLPACCSAFGWGTALCQTLEVSPVAGSCRTCPPCLASATQGGFQSCSSYHSCSAVRMLIGGAACRVLGHVIAQAEGLEGAKGHFEHTWAHFQEALDKMPEAERGKKLKPVQARSPPLLAGVGVALQIRPRAGPRAGCGG